MLMTEVEQIKQLIETLKKERDVNRESNPEKGRLLSIAITHLETAMLYTKEAIN